MNVFDSIIGVVFNLRNKGMHESAIWTIYKFSDLETANALGTKFGNKSNADLLTENVLRDNAFLKLLKMKNARLR